MFMFWKLCVVFCRCRFINMCRHSTLVYVQTCTIVLHLFISMYNHSMHFVYKCIQTFQKGLQMSIELPQRSIYKCVYRPSIQVYAHNCVQLCRPSTQVYVQICTDLPLKFMYTYVQTFHTSLYANANYIMYKRICNVYKCVHIFYADAYTNV